MTIAQEYGIETNSIQAKQSLIDLAWANLPLSFIDWLQEFFNLKVSGKLSAITYKLNPISWKGLSIPWQIEENSANCEIRLDKNLVLHLISQSLGHEKTDNYFSCRNLNDLEQEILENFMQGLIEKTEEVFSDRQAEFSGESVYLIWLVQTGRELGKLALALPKELLEGINFQPIWSEKQLQIVSLKLTLRAGSSILTLQELIDLEVGDFILLESSKSNILRIQGNYAIQVEINDCIPQISLPSEEKMSTISNKIDKETLNSLPVEVKAEFREIKMTLKDLFSLQTETVLPLQKVTESALFLTSQDKTIAKGELVVVNDRFGILIKEIFLGEAENITKEETGQNFDDMLDDEEEN